MPTEAVTEAATEAVVEIATEVIEVVTTADPIELLQSIMTNTETSAYVLNLIAGMLLFFVVVALCYFSYKFFRIFF